MRHPAGLLIATLAAGLLFAGCSTFQSATAPEPEPAPTPTEQTADADAPADDSTDGPIDPQVAKLYDLEARLVAAEWEWQKRALLNQAMAELVALLDSEPDLLVENPEFRAVHRGLMAEYRRFHGYGVRDTMETARGDIFAFRADLFDALNNVDEPLLEDVMEPVKGERPGTEVPMTTNRLVKRSIEYLQEQPASSSC